MTLSRRKLIGSLISLVAAPAIVRVSSIMPVKAGDDTLFTLHRYGYVVTGTGPMDSLLNARLNECYDVISRAMREMMFRDHGATGFDLFRKHADG